MHPRKVSDQTKQLTQQTMPLAGLPLYPPARIQANTSWSIWRQGIARRILWASQRACSGSLGTRQFSICHCSQLPWGLGWGPQTCTQVTTFKVRWGRPCFCSTADRRYCGQDAGFSEGAYKNFKEDCKETHPPEKFPGYPQSHTSLTFSSA